MEYLDSITTIISTIGFPITMCGLMGWYVKYTHDDNKKTYEDMRYQHTEQIKILSNTIDRAVDVIEINNEYIRKEK